MSASSASASLWSRGPVRWGATAAALALALVWTSTWFSQNGWQHGRWRASAAFGAIGVYHFTQPRTTSGWVSSPIKAGFKGTLKYWTRPVAEPTGSGNLYTLPLYIPFLLCGGVALAAWRATYRRRRPKAVRPRLATSADSP